MKAKITTGVDFNALRIARQERYKRMEKRIIAVCRARMREIKKRSESCYNCEKTVDPMSNKVIYHSFTGGYFCSTECFIASQQNIE